MGRWWQVKDACAEQWYHIVVTMWYTMDLLVTVWVTLVTEVCRKAWVSMSLLKQCIDTVGLVTNICTPMVI